MSREVPFEPDVPCDVCGKMGSWDFMGTSLCAECFQKYNEQTDGKE